MATLRTQPSQVFAGVLLSATRVLRDLKSASVTKYVFALGVRKPWYRRNVRLQAGDRTVIIRVRCPHVANNLSELPLWFDIWMRGVKYLEHGVRAMTDNLETLAPRPQSPNCVCSDEDPRSSKYIAPFVSDRADATQGSADGQRLLAAIATYLESRPEFRIVKRSDSGPQIEARSRPAFRRRH